MFKKIMNFIKGEDSNYNKILQEINSKSYPLKKVVYVKNDLSERPKISLDKSNETFKKVISLKKKDDIKARVSLVMDYSGSMKHLYDNGVVSDTFTRLLPLALKFDDNGELEAWLFSNFTCRLPEVTINNYKTFVEEEILNSDYNMGGTYFSPTIEDIRERYYNQEPSEINNYVIFITDGSNFDVESTQVSLSKLDSKTFIQFICMGGHFKSEISVIQKMLAPFNNTGIIRIDNIDKVSNKALYEALMENYNK